MKICMITSSYPKFPGDVTAPFIESIARARQEVADGRSVGYAELNHRLDPG